MRLSGFEDRSVYNVFGNKIPSTCRRQNKGGKKPRPIIRYYSCNTPTRQGSKCHIIVLYQNIQTQEED